MTYIIHWKCNQCSKTVSIVDYESDTIYPEIIVNAYGWCPHCQGYTNQQSKTYLKGDK